MKALDAAVQQLVDTEDIRRPLTDQQMAELLKEKRSSVTLTRQRLGIPDSRERIRPALRQQIAEILAREPRLSDREVTRMVKSLGYDVSRFTVAAVCREVRPSPPAGEAAGVEPARPAPKPVPLSGGDQPAPDPFARVIGHKDSLRPVIQQAKAAVLYPPSGLHTLILGPAGVGKSELAQAMHRFAVQQRDRDIPLVTFNCADYAENPQLLISQLFGHVRGAFTGADTAKVGLVERADGGILFLDEVHRLPSEGQELLFHLMDRGRFRRLGETDSERAANVMIIAATTEKPESSLLMTFRRRIPMVIEIPALSQRPLSERLRIVRYFLRQEAARTGEPIRLRAEALYAFLLYDCPGNVGQLKSDIQVAAARAFLVQVTEGAPTMEIEVSNLPGYVRQGLLRLPSHRDELEWLQAGDLMVVPEERFRASPQDDLYTLPGDIYQYIETRVDELRAARLPEREVNRTISSDLEDRLRQHLRLIQRQATGAFQREELVKVVGRELVDVVEEMLDLVRPDIPVDQHVFYCVAVHLNAAINRVREGRPTLNPDVESVRSKYPVEFARAVEMLRFLSRRLQVTLPESEAVFLSLYLRGALQPEGRVGVVVMSHGQVASRMVEVANRILAGSHVRWLELALDEPPEASLPRAEAVVREAGEGKGVLLLVDMGSLVAFAETVGQRVGIPVRCVDRVDTIMVMEAARRASLPGATLDEVAGAIAFSRHVGVHLSPSDTRKTAVVTLCLTGEGTAVHLKNLLERVMGTDAVEIVTVGAVGADPVSEIDNLNHRVRVAAIVGTVDPRHPTIPFIPASSLTFGAGADLLRSRVRGATRAPEPSEVVREDLTLLQMESSDRTEVLDRLGRMLLVGGHVTDAFLTDVYRRELLSPTVLSGGVAIPHGEPEHVVRPAIAVATLRRPVDWAGSPVDIVCLLALTDSDKETFVGLYRLLQSGRQRDALRRARAWDDIRSLLEGLRPAAP